MRGAVSIARRLQDPLAELVKIDPKSIGVGQYQHDVSEAKLSRSLDAVVEDCVNAVGVDVNTASAPLLARVSGIGDALAQSIVAIATRTAPFRSRAALKEVPRLGPRPSSNAAGFLRINDGENPLDRPACIPKPIRWCDAFSRRPERHRVADRQRASFCALKPANFVDETFGLPTVIDIFRELEKPGRDPRPAFKTASSRRASRRSAISSRA